MIRLKVKVQGFQLVLLRKIRKKLNKLWPIRSKN